MVDLAAAAGLPRPEIEEYGDCVTVRFRHAGYVPTRGDGNDLIKRQEAILALLDRANDGLALREIVTGLAFATSERQVKRALAEATGRGRTPGGDGFDFETANRPPAALGVLLGSHRGLIHVGLESLPVARQIRIPLRTVESPWGYKPRSTPSSATLPTTSGRAIQRLSDFPVNSVCHVGVGSTIPEQETRLHI